MARTNGSNNLESKPPDEVLLSDAEKLAILADLMFEIIMQVEAEEASLCLAT
jgi:hypothetical protein